MKISNELISILQSPVNNTTLIGIEIYILERAMAENQFNQSKTARVLNMSRTTLRSKLKHYFGNKYIL